MIGLVGELQDAKHPVSEMEQKRALLRGIPSDLNVFIEAIMGVDTTYSKALAKFVGREIRVREK